MERKPVLQEPRKSQDRFLGLALLLDLQARMGKPW